MIAPTGTRGHLVAPGAQHGELVIPSTEQAIRRAAHQEQALGLRPMPPEDAERALNEQPTFDEAFPDAMRKIVQLAQS